MSEFVEQCRGEWRRIGVADPLAEEMAADLTSDLEEAEAEGVSVDELLGSDASDPRSFAAAWAAERGIIPDPLTRRPFDGSRSFSWPSPPSQRSRSSSRRSCSLPGSRK